MSIKSAEKNIKKLSPQGFTIRALKPANPKNARGKRTWEYKMSNGSQISFYSRLKGEKLGNHFHKGKNPSKNPEIIIFTSGIVQLKLIYLSGKQKTIIINATKSPQKLLLSPYILHLFEVKTNCTYVEYKPTWFNKKSLDTFSEAEFLKIQSQNS
jgi:hypothetical protein